MYVINKTVISNTAPENKYVFWYQPKTERVYMYREDGWQPLDKLEEFQQIKNKLEEIKSTVIDTNTYVKTFQECTEEEILDMFTEYTVQDGWLYLGYIDVEYPTMQQLQNTVYLQGLTIKID